jgi:predicted DNA-binding transcriptional regulator YafY
MRRADRLFDIIQDLRWASHPVIAAALASKLEVTVRMIYRDIEALHRRRIPTTTDLLAGPSKLHARWRSVGT